MKKTLSALAMGASVLGLGLSMPSCPGQQAMQQQVDALQASHAESLKKIQGLQQQVTSLTTEMGQVKQLLPQMTNVIQSQKGAIERLENDVKMLQQHKGPAAKGGAKKKGK